VVAQIAGLSLALPAGVATIAEEASVEVARFDAEPGTEVAPFASVLLRSESSSSSKIEKLASGAKPIALPSSAAATRQRAREPAGGGPDQ